MDVGGARRLLDLLVGGVETPVAQVLADGRVEQHGLLQHHPDLAAQRGQVDAADVMAVDRDVAPHDVVMPAEQADHGGLAAAAAPDEGDQLARLDRQVDVLSTNCSGS
jgi:hypothetical protein